MVAYSILNETDFDQHLFKGSFCNSLKVSQNMFNDSFLPKSPSPTRSSRLFRSAAPLILFLQTAFDLL